MGRKKRNQQPMNVDIFGDTEVNVPNTTNFQDVRAELLHNIEVLNKLLFSPNAKLRDAAKAINEMLTVVENILLSGFFKEYEKWIVENKGDVNQLPEELIVLGEKVHKLIVSRGKLVMDMLQQIKEDEEKEVETKAPIPSTNLFRLPNEVEDYLEDNED